MSLMQLTKIIRLLNNPRIYIYDYHKYVVQYWTNLTVTMNYCKSIFY